MCEEISGIKGLGTEKKIINHQSALAHAAACSYACREVDLNHNLYHMAAHAVETFHTVTHTEVDILLFLFYLVFWLHSA